MAKNGYAKQFNKKLRNIINYLPIKSQRSQNSYFKNQYQESKKEFQKLLFFYIFHFDYFKYRYHITLV